MGRKSKGGGGKAEEEAPFCYYCDREFKDEAVLIDHQKAIHFKCKTCGKRMTTVEALRVHHANVRRPTRRASCEPCRPPPDTHPLPPPHTPPCRRTRRR